MFSISIARRRQSMKLLAGAAATAIAATTFGLTAPAFAAPASPVRPIIETGSFTGDPANAITNGWWGHETSGATGSSIFSFDAKGTAASPSAGLAAQLAKIGPDATVNNLHVAFVLTSADGSAEKPAISAGETVGSAFTWFDASAAGHSISGTTSINDYVDALSTETSYNAWYNAGQPVYGFDANLHATDSAGTPCTPGTGGCGTNGAPLSGAHAIGTSILNTWPANTNVSLVLYVSTSTNANNEPIVKAGTDGHAESIWMPFTTVAQTHDRDPVGSTFPASYDSIRTSAGYAVAGAAVAPTVHLSDSWTGGNGMLNASLTDGSNHALTNATGTVQFYSRPLDATGGTWSTYGSPVTVSATGTASLPITGLTSGHSQEFEATYSPDSAASAIYTTATSSIDQVFAPASTTTTLAVGGTLRYPYKQTLSATVASSAGTPAGSVTFMDHGVGIGTVALTSGHASLAKALTIGSHSLSVKYNGGTGFNTSTSAVRAVVIGKALPTITPSLYPIASRLVHGNRPRLTVAVRTYGLTPTGTVTIVVVAPNRVTTTLRVTLRSGNGVVYLPAVLRGTTKLTIKYSGSTTVSAGTKYYSFYVSR